MGLEGISNLHIFKLYYDHEILCRLKEQKEYPTRILREMIYNFDLHYTGLGAYCSSKELESNKHSERLTLLQKNEENVERLVKFKPR